ncbi:MAG: copper-binding protein, partial [Candidatus Accumulibacter sp.]|nr:copper-binding protein [Accumulibacter sp.]
AGFVLFPAHAAQGGHGAHADHGGHAGAPVAVSAEDSLVDGTVKKIDKASGKITLAHGPLTNLNMPHAMTMAFRVKDLSWLDQMRVGDRIRFVADSVGGALTIVRFEAVK